MSVALSFGCSGKAEGEHSWRGPNVLLSDANVLGGVCDCTLRSHPHCSVPIQQHVPLVKGLKGGQHTAGCWECPFHHHCVPVEECRLTRGELDALLKDGMKWTERQGLSWEEDRQLCARLRR